MIGYIKHTNNTNFKMIPNLGLYMSDQIIGRGRVRNGTNFFCLLMLLFYSKNFHNGNFRYTMNHTFQSNYFVLVWIRLICNILVLAYI